MYLIPFRITYKGLQSLFCWARKGTQMPGRLLTDSRHSYSSCCDPSMVLSTSEAGWVLHVVETHVSTTDIQTGGVNCVNYRSAV